MCGLSEWWELAAALLTLALRVRRTTQRGNELYGFRQISEPSSVARSYHLTCLQRVERLGVVGLYPPAT